ncbi:SGNH/GDSL hydrolase family protein [Methylocella tundrae]|uniref:SGNH hydrolase-type esterase domain-containing protein n=1 Tax=Methylocella tundrae TaxID=227605 RepID=A0A4U8Z487_METTU|nr:SGNH/GDSL hydrolase family protein [Methylocella tundrae]WPP04037.1 SGNH/GDSL hydrolase family protein [Methylocella tundrae]VFU10268.1 conserved protein of unknown function [Methylocella tundrae]
MGALPANVASGETIYAKIRRVAGVAKDNHPHMIDPTTGLPQLMANPPTITAGAYANQAAATTAGYSKVYTALANQNIFYSTGGWTTWYATNYLRLPSTTVFPTGNGNAGSNPNIAASSGRHTFIADSAKFLVGTTGSSNFRLIVDGKYVSLSPIVSSAASPSLTLVDFTSVGGRQRRRISIETQSNTAFYGVDVGPTEGLYAVSSVDHIRYIQMGDSITFDTMTGTPAVPGDGFGHVMADRLGISDYRPAGNGGTGYAANNNGAGLRMQEHMFDALNWSPDIIGLCAGINDDSAFGWAASQPGLASCIGQARAYSATLPVLVFGVIGSAGGALAAAHASWEASLSAYLSALNDPNIIYVPIVTDPAGPTFTGSGSVAAPAGDGNSDLYFAVSGSPHPNVAGHTHLGYRMADGVLTAIMGKA